MNSPSPSPPGVRAWLPGLVAVLVVVAAVYAPTVDDYFGGDDFMVLGPVRALGPWELIWKSAVFRDDIPYWRPLVSPLYAFEVHVFQLRPWPYHLVAVGLHLVNVVLLAAVAWTLTGRRWVALAAALTFGIHPAKTTTVPMISSTVELFAMVWYLLAVLCCLRFVQGNGRRWYWLGVLAFLLGLLSKESVATAAAAVSLLFLFIGFLPARRGQVRHEAGRLVRRALPFWLLVVPYVWLTFRMEREDPTGVVKAMYFAGPHIGQNLWWFLARLAAPLEIGRGPTVGNWGHAGAVALLIGGALVLLRGSNAARLLVLWTIAALTPLALWRPEYLVGRFTYMATAPYAILLALAGASAAERIGRLLPRPVPRWAPGAALLAVGTVVGGWLTVAQSVERTQEGEMYRVLVSTLRESHTELPDGSQVILLDGVWRGPFHAVFLNSVADTLYGPGRVRIVNVDRARTRPRQHPRRSVELRYDAGVLRPEDSDAASD